MGLLNRLLLLEEVSSKKKDIINNNIRKRLYKIFKHEGHLEQVISPREPIVDEEREQIIKSNILIMSLPITMALIQTDPTDNGQYLSWLYKVFIKNDHYLPTREEELKHPQYTLDKINEDSDRVRSYLKIFHENRPLIKRQGDSIDINDYDSPQELLSAIEQFRTELTDDGQLIITREFIENNFDDDEAEVFFENDKWIVVIPRTERASCIIAVDSEWCTSYGEHSPKQSKRDRTSYFSSYKDDPLFIVQNKNNPNEIYQFSFESEEYMDKIDSKIDISDFFENNEDLKKKFNEAGYFESKSKKINHLILEEEYDEAVYEINRLGYGVISVQEIEDNLIITDIDLYDDGDMVLEKILNIDKSDVGTYFSEISEYLTGSSDEFLVGTKFELYDELLKSAKFYDKEIIDRDDLDELEITPDNVDKDLYENLQEYIKTIIEYVGYIEVDGKYYFSYYYDYYGEYDFIIEVQNTHVDGRVYESINRIDEIKDEIDVELDPIIKQNIKLIKEYELTFNDYEELIMLLSTPINIRSMTIDDPDQMEMKFENSLIKYLLKKKFK